MKNQFKGYYSPKTKELNKAWKSKETVFVFDTNIFLNLYSYAEKTREDFFEVLEKINEQIWIPYHVGLEYQKRRLTVVRNEKAVFSKIEQSLEKIEKVFKSELKQLNLEQRFPKLNVNTEKLEKDIIKSISKYKQSLHHWDKKQPCVRSHDSIREKLNELFESKVGLKPKDQDEINLIQEEGEKRYENQIPPGFKDSVKDKDEKPYFSYDNIKYERKFGDLILWNQVINKAKDENIKNVIFITDDAKEDWWYIIDSRGKKRIGPHADLQSEIYNKSDINLFHMYNTSTFLEEGKEVLELGISDDSITEIDNLFNMKLSKRIELERIKNKETEKIFKYNNYITDIKLRSKLKDKKNSDKNYNYDNIENIDKIYKDYSEYNFNDENLEITKNNKSISDKVADFLDSRNKELDDEKIIRIIKYYNEKNK
jgi:predicted nucleic acid-binding protein